MAWRWILVAGIFLIFMFKLFLRTMNTSSSHPNLSCYVYVSLFCIFAAVLNGTQRTVEPDALAQWSFFGEGFVALDVQAQHIVLAETPGSKGVMLVSPESHLGDCTLSYKIRPLTPESVLVAILAASNCGPDGDLDFPENYNGNMRYLTTDTDNYFFAFHNAAHNAQPFIRKYSKETAGHEQLVRADANMMTTQWHAVEVGKRDGRLWLKVDGQTIIEATDASPLAQGHFILRLRGTKDSIGVCLIKDLRIDGVDG